MQDQPKGWYLTTERSPEIYPTLTASDVPKLNFDVEEVIAFPIVWCTSSFLSSLWQLRVEKKKVELIKIRSDMESKVRLLRVPRLMKTSEIISKGINYMLDSKHQISHMSAFLILFQSISHPGACEYGGLTVYSPHRCWLVKESDGS